MLKLLHLRNRGLISRLETMLNCGLRVGSTAANQACTTAILGHLGCCSTFTFLILLRELVLVGVVRVGRLVMSTIVMMV